LKSLLNRLAKISFAAGFLVFASITSSQVDTINLFQQTDLQVPPTFTEVEKKWLADNPVVYFSDDASGQPFAYIDKDNKLTGISVDFLNHIQKHTGIQFELFPSDTWLQVLTKIKEKKITLALAAIKTQERSKFADFSVPYFSSKMAFVTGEEYSYIQRAEELYGRTVAIPVGYYTVDYLRKNHPQIRIKLVDTLEQAFAAVSDGEADAFLGTLAVAAFRLRNSKYSSLKISGTIDEETEIRYIIAKGNEPFVSIVDKIFTRITDHDKRAIINNWFGVKIENGIAPETIWKIIFIAGTIILLALIWIRQLKKEVFLRKKTERKLILSREEAYTANRAKSEFLANMSHEIRTPMNAVIAFSDLLSDTPLSTEQKEYVESIKVGSSGLLHIINGVLEISKIEAGEVNIEYAPTSLSQLSDRLTKLFSASMNEKNINFSIEISDNCPERFITDVHRLQQILINLIGNALKFTSEGYIKLNISAIVSSSSSNISLIFELSDTGIGIAQERQNLVFEQFIRCKNSEDNPLGGTGLGLSISKKLSEALGGSLSLTSEVDVGSCFTLKLNNIKIDDSQTRSSEKIRNIEFKKAKILIVDDIETNRIILEKYLSPFPFKILHAENGQHAVELALSEKPDLVLMDIRMPIMDGYEATENIRKEIDTYIIAVTASALEDEESKDKKKLFDVYLRKPVLRDDLIETLESLLVKD